MLYNFVLLTTSFWVVLHGVRHFLEQKGHGREAVLPLTSRRRPGRSIFSRTLAVFLDKETTTFTLRDVRLHVVTTGLNHAQDSLSSILRRGQIGRLARLFYDIGTLIGMVITSCSVFVLGWLVVTLTKPFLVDSTPVSSNPLIQMNPNFLSPEEQFGMIIPGVTVPIFHLPLIICATLFCLIIHEAGHSISAAIDAVRMLSAGVSFSLLIPSAFVSFSSQSIATLSPWSRARIASAGAWHNLVFWIILWLISSSGLGRTLGSILAWPAYQSLGDSGLVVLAIDQDSPLHEHLPLGSLITALDDTPVSSNELWTRYLLNNQSDSSLGWCVSINWLLEQTNECCSSARDSTATTQSCFTRLNQKQHDHEIFCLDPLLIMDPAVWSAEGSVSGERCTESCSAAGATEYACIRPREDERLLRIGLETSPWVEAATSRVIVWRGPREEVWEQIQVGGLRPRASVVPLYLPTIVNLFFSYLSLVTFSLFAFNLIPVPWLDGTEILESCIELAFTRFIMQTGGVGPNLANMDMEMSVRVMEDDDRWIRRWKGRIRTLITRASIMLVFSTVALSLLTK